MCIATMKSITAAERARSALSAAGIFVSVISLDPSLTKKGCAYGIEFYGKDKTKVKSILRKKGISYGEIIGGSL